MLGAYPAEWNAFQQAGFTDKLLPIVQDLTVKISEKSKLKELGKTPSIINGNGEAAGITNWTNKTTTYGEVQAWSQNDKLGFCINLKDNYAAIDIDVDNKEVVDSIVNHLRVKFNMSDFAMRYRSNSSRVLIPIKIKGDKPFNKVRFTADGVTDAIEVLGKGNQFVAAGTHPSGARYAWTGYLTYIPEYTADELFNLVKDIANIHGLTKCSKDKGTKRVKGENIAKEDRIADFLRSSGLALSETKDYITVKCPNCENHTSGVDGDGSTCYFKAGSNGYPDGAFKCLHAHCSHLNINHFIDYLEKKGFSYVDSNDLPVIEYSEDKDGDKDTYNPKLGELSSILHKYMDKECRVKAVLPAVTAVLKCKEAIGHEIIYDTFKQQLSSKSNATGKWHTLNDSDHIELRHFLESELNFLPVGKELMRDALDLVASKNKVDSMLEYLKATLPAWDGTPRVDKFFNVYCGTEDTEYTRAVSRYLWTALFGRAISVDGIKADITPILIGEQGSKKSTLISTLAIDPETYTDISLRNRDDNIKRMLRGKVVVEIPELDGLSKRDVEDVKAFLTKTFDEYVPKYKESTIVQQRRCLFIMSTNEEQFLTDTTGNRRFAPIKVSAINIDLVKRDLLQLWAEARQLFYLYGIDHKSVELLAKEANDDAMIVDVWNDNVQAWLDGRIAQGFESYSASEILEGALGIVPASVTIRETKRLASVMRSLGYKQIRKRENSKASRVYVKS